MTKKAIHTVAMTVVLLSAGLGSARAQNGNGTTPAPATATPGRPGLPPTLAPGAAAAPAPAFAQIAPGYPYLNAPMYVCPRPDVPYQMGGTFITNQAFYPQEMMHPHEYKAMYPPFYYRAHGGWIVTPFGVRSHESWRLQGTVVKVKYRPRYSLFSAFHPPVLR